MGVQESQIPLMVLKAPSLPDPSLPAPVGVEFDKSQVEELSYDNLCCSKIGESCQPGDKARPQCCAGAFCAAPPPSGGVQPDGICQFACLGEGAPCTSMNDCCQSSPTSLMVCGSMKTCERCKLQNEPCNTDGDCCGNFDGLTCDLNLFTCQPPPVHGPG